MAELLTPELVERLAAGYAKMLAALKQMYEPNRNGDHSMQGVVWLGDLIREIEPDYQDPWKKLGEEMGYGDGCECLPTCGINSLCPIHGDKF